MHRSIIGTKPTLLLYHGWLVVAAAFLVALVRVWSRLLWAGHLPRDAHTLHGWPTSELSSAITAYYVLGATLLFFWVGPLFEHHGPRKIVVVGTVAMACGVVAARLYHSVLAGLCGIRRDVGWVGHNERRSDQHHCSTLVRQSPRSGPQLGDERGKCWRHHYRTVADLPNRPVRLCLCDCIGIRIHARHPNSGSYRDAPPEAGQ